VKEIGENTLKELVVIEFHKKKGNSFQNRPRGRNFL